VHAKVVGGHSMSMPATVLAVWALARVVGAMQQLAVPLVAQVAVTRHVGVCAVALLLGVVLRLQAQGAGVATTPLGVAGRLVLHSVCQVCLAAITWHAVLEALRALVDGNGQVANCGQHGCVQLDNLLYNGVVAHR
jgi:hypothetical protein